MRSRRGNWLSVATRSSWCKNWSDWSRVVNAYHVCKLEILWIYGEERYTFEYLSKQRQPDKIPHFNSLFRICTGNQNVGNLNYSRSSWCKIIRLGMESLQTSHTSVIRGLTTLPIMNIHLGPSVKKASCGFHSVPDTWKWISMLVGATHFRRPTPNHRTSQHHGTAAYIYFHKWREDWENTIEADSTCSLPIAQRIRDGEGSLKEVFESRRDLRGDI